MKPEIAECRKLAKKYGVKVVFKKLKGAVAGYCDIENELITINSYLSSRQEILSCWFHELVHILCHRKGLWKSYHNGGSDMMKTAVKAEKYMDRVAEHELFLWDKRVRYLGSYADGDPEEIKEFLEDYYKDSHE